MLATGTDDFSGVADASYLGFLSSLGSSLFWKSALGGSNDDAQVKENVLLSLDRADSHLVDNSGLVEDGGLQVRQGSRRRVFRCMN
jgi:hypothetical protein